MMKHTSFLKTLNQRGFDHMVVGILIVVIFGVIGSAYLVVSHALVPRATIFTGTISYDGCAHSKLPVGDVGCSITVTFGNRTNGAVPVPRIVTIAHGNARQTAPWGQVIGFASLTTDYTGRQVTVYAKPTGGNNYTLAGSAAYYVKLLPAPSPKAITFTGTITYDGCAHSKLPIGDVGCSISVGTSVPPKAGISITPRVVAVAHGNTVQTAPWGHVIGFASLTTDYTGRQVTVYAQPTGGNSYTLEGSTSYYAKLLPIPVDGQPVTSATTTTP